MPRELSTRALKASMRGNLRGSRWYSMEAEGMLASSSPSHASMKEGPAPLPATHRLLLPQSRADEDAVCGLACVAPDWG